MSVRWSEFSNAMEEGGGQDVVEKSWKHFPDSLVPHGEALPLWLHSEDQMVLVQDARTQQWFFCPNPRSAAPPHQGRVPSSKSAMEDELLRLTPHTPFSLGSQGGQVRVTLRTPGWFPLFCPLPRPIWTLLIHDYGLIKLARI